MKKTIVILTLAVLGITGVNAGVHFGINFGSPLPVPVVTAPPVPVVTASAVVPGPMPPPIVEVAPACPTPGYVWIGGTWGWCDNHWVWTRGHWNLPAHWGYGFRGDHREEFRHAYTGEHGRR